MTAPRTLPPPPSPKIREAQALITEIGQTTEASERARLEAKLEAVLRAMKPGGAA
jgi:hypothetical protein